MKKIDVQDYDYEKLFSVYLDNEKRMFKSVGIGENGEYILVESAEYNIGSAYDAIEQYYELTVSEVKEYAKQALSNKRISLAEYDEILASL